VLITVVITIRVIIRRIYVVRFFKSRLKIRRF